VAGNGVLSGFRVIDMCHGLAGPSATRILASLGADVIKIEMPDTGEFTRQVVPYVFRSHNRDKRSLAVDLKSPKGLEIARRVAATGDVFVQSQRPGLVESLGLDRQSLSTLNPSLIYASITGFGEHGPDAQRKAVDMLAQAESGLAIAQSGLLGNLSFVDAAAGLSLANGILAALMRRQRDGHVQHVDLSLLDTAIYLQSAPLAEFSATGVWIDQTSYWQRYATVGLFDTADGPIFIAGYWNRDWVTMCRLFGRPELATDPRYAETASRTAHAQEVRSIINAGFASWSRAALIAELEGHGIMAGAVRSYAEVLKSAQVAANGTFLTDTGPDGARTLFPKLPFRMSPDDGPLSRPAPRVGDATVPILRELGLDEAEVAELLDAKIVTAQPARSPVPATAQCPPGRP
jgi:crotonobetainyl-CoA:carnitine CoA-transferase CaiB-like acyl-CoA transferase